MIRLLYKKKVPINEFLRIIKTVIIIIILIILIICLLIHNACIIIMLLCHRIILNQNVKIIEFIDETSFNIINIANINKAVILISGDNPL